jgi:galactokinase
MEDAQWSLVEQDRGDAFCARVAEKYWADTGVEPLVFQVEAAPGAGVVNV